MRSSILQPEGGVDEVDDEGHKQFGAGLHGEDLQSCELYYKTPPSDLSLHFPTFGTQDGQSIRMDNDLPHGFPLELRSREASDDTSKSNPDDSKSTPDEKDAKERKKAQNRAAQKAFRERREAKLKELEEKLKESEANRKELTDELEALKRQQVVANNEKILLHDRQHFEHGMSFSASVQTYTFPTQRQFYDSLTESKHGAFRNDQKRYLDDSGNEVLPLSAAWEYLHDLSQQMDFDIYLVMQSLKGSEICHGHGAAYPRALIDQAVQAATADSNSL